VAEATNFGVPEWIPFGRLARVCMCRPDSVRIDMRRLEHLLARYRKETSKTTARRRKSYRDWGILHAQKYNRRDDSSSESESDSEDENESDNKKATSSGQKKTRMKDFWVEVMTPVPSSQRGVPRDDIKRKKKKAEKVTPKKRKQSKGKQNNLQEHRERWHLAKPMTQKALQAGTKVLVMIPGVVANDEISSSSSDSDSDSEKEVEEQCFAGVITEFVDDYCRVHFERLTKEDDVWMHIYSPKLFLDGGAWDESHEIKGVPPKHYWQVMDSKRRCV
jgi:hypothetical protein